MPAINNLTKPLDEVLLVLRILKRLGTGNLTTLKERIMCQKTQYFAQLFRVSVPYHFNLYIYGPYSPELANDLFKIENTNYTISTERFAADELEERFEKLRQFLENKDLPTREIIATLHWLINAGNTPEQAATKVLQLKNAKPEEIKKAQQTLVELPE